MTVHEPAEAGPEARGQPRSSLFLAAVLRVEGEQAPVKVRNMSMNGAMVESPLTPPPGTTVQLVRGTLVAEGTIVWSSNKRCGLRFTSALSVKDWLAAPTMAEQQRVDAIVSLVKAGAIPTAFAGTGNFDAPSAHRAKRRLVDDLEDVVRLMQDLEGDLASSQETLSRHGMKLQNLDIAMQMVRAIANELTPARDGAHSREAALEDLRVVCAQALAKSEDK